MTTWALRLLVALALMATASAPALAAPAPLLMEGKKTLYQRVLTRPGAVFAATAGGPATGAHVPPLSILYVYQRQTAGNADWLELGSNTQGKTIGWAKTDDTIPWKQSLTLAFANPAGRDRVLFFNDRKGLLDVLDAPDPGKQAADLHAAIDRNALPPGSPVVSIEPPTFVDISKQFYLLPILDTERVRLPSSFQARLVHIASATLEPAKTTVAEQVKNRSNPADAAALANFSAAIVFVIDATKSMGPYIERTREAVRRIYQEIERQGLNDRVRFGLVAFRDDPKAVKGIEYLAKVFAKPDQARTADEFLKLVSGVNEAKVSSRAFSEDGYAGLDTAVREIDWTHFGARYLVTITDAAAREGNEPFASTGLGTPEMRREMLDHGIAAYVLHLLTPEGNSNHEKARREYEQLSDYPGVGPLYFPVATGSVEAYGQAVDQLAAALTRQVAEARGGRSSNGFGDPAPTASADRGSMEARSEAVGLAMRLAYLGRVQGAAAPSLFEAWTSDRDIQHPETPSLEVRVLLTRNELSDLQETLKAIVRAGKVSELAPEDFFNELRSAAATLSRDPSRVGRQGTRNLADSGLMGEYLDDLPYQSKVMGIDQALWSSWSVGEQQAFIDEVESKIRLYQRYYEDTGRWVALDEGAAPGDAVYPVPLDALP